MHWTTCARSSRASRTTRSAHPRALTRPAHSWPRPLEDGTAARRSTRSNWRSGINRTRSGLWHDDATRRRSRWAGRRSYSRNRRNGASTFSRDRSSRNSRFCSRSTCRSRSGSGWRIDRSYRSRSNRSRRRSGCLYRLSSRGSGNGSSRCRSRRDDRGPRYNRSSGRRSDSDGRLRDHWPNRRPAGNRRSSYRGTGSARRSNNIRPLPWQRNDPARSNHIGSVGRRCAGSGDRNSAGRSSRYRRAHRSSAGNYRRRSNHDCLRTRWRRIAGVLFSLLALQNCLQGVSGLGDLGQVKPRLGIRRRSARGRTTASAVEVSADPFRLVGLDRTGVRLTRYPERLERIENRPALYFQFTCQIIDSNFAHPSLFSCSLRR
ncbi:MAG: hypothetical protein JWM43_1333 [Acidobacteriaceae bacterium]|nr:hypothetical protein [Acidobacteriaceae bacterium]